MGLETLIIVITCIIVCAVIIVRRHSCEAVLKQIMQRMSAIEKEHLNAIDENKRLSDRLSDMQQMLAILVVDTESPTALAIKERIKDKAFNVLEQALDPWREKAIEALKRSDIKAAVIKLLASSLQKREKDMVIMAEIRYNNLRHLVLEGKISEDSKEYTTAFNAIAEALLHIAQV